VIDILAHTLGLSLGEALALRRWRVSFHFARWRFALLNILAVASLPNICVAEDRGWEFEPYRIHAHVVLDVPGGIAEQLSQELPQYLAKRAEAAFGAAWSLDVKLTTGQSRRTVISHLESNPSEPPENFPGDAGKLLLVSVTWSPEGYEIQAREFDRYVARWSPVIRRHSRQSEMVPEQLFAIISRTVAPLFRLELNPNDPKQVGLHARGAALKWSEADSSFVKPGDMLLPVLRRTLRGGEVAENGIQAVPYTFVEVVALEDGTLAGHVHSGNRQPFGVRRLGRIEQIAIAVRADASPTRLHLHSRSDPDKPLVGYEVFLQHSGDESTQRIGSTDRSGFITIEPTESPLQMLVIKSGTQLLGRLPIVPGAEAIVKVPLPDDDARLTAEARLAALREDLVDVVARRNILMARARHKIEQNELSEAQELLRTIDQLPGRSQFNLALSTASRVVRSDEPQIQRRIDQLFQATQTVMNQYLDTRPVNELHEELRQARQKGG
jgi:hypothetical protein